MGEAARAAIADAVGDRVGKFDHLNGAGPVWQPADEAALFQGRNQPVNAGFRAEIERILHFIEGRRHARLGQALVNKAQQFALFLRQHGGLLVLGCRADRPEGASTQTSS